MDAWSHLAESAEFGEWFAGPQWIVPLLATYFSDRRHSIYFVYERSRLVGVVPFVGSARNVGACSAKLALPVNAHVRRIGMLCAYSPALVLAAVLQHVRATRGLGRSCVGLLQVPVGDWFDRSIRECAIVTGLSRHSISETRSAIIELPNGWDAYVATRTGEQLHTLRKQRKLKGKGLDTWELSTVGEKVTLPEAWGSILHVEERSWKHETGTSLVNDPGASSFYGMVAESHAMNGRLRIDLLRRNDVAVAHCLGVVYGQTYYLLKHSFDEAHRGISPGFQLLWYALGKRADEGCTRLDLLGDEMSWKRALATSLPEYVSHRLFEPTALMCQLCRFTDDVLKPAARKMGVKRLVSSAKSRFTRNA